MGHAFIDPEAFPTAWAAAGVPTVLGALAIIAALFTLGWWVFAREAPRVAEHL